MRNERETKAFEVAENLGRSKALNALASVNFGKDVRIVNMPMDKEWDFEVRENGSNRLVAVIEAKDRKFKSNDWRVVREGVQLEERKFNVLCGMHLKKNVPAYYLATFEDGKFFMWDVVDAPHTENDKMCNRTTAVKTGKVLKHCYYFRSGDAKFKGVA